ncbi:MAG: glycosyltransferase family 4 protein [Verrucomicrobia bacterium]|nr:glycosyltransferase family 4 protein [Verrucomicrobiota bacterium]
MKPVARPVGSAFVRVLLVGNYLPDGEDHMRRFGRVLAEELPGLGVGTHLLRPAVRWGRRVARSRGLGRWLGYADKFVDFPRQLRQAVRWHRTMSESSFVVHVCDHANAMYTRHLRGVPHLVTCHDLLAVRAARGEFREHTPRWTGQWWPRMMLDGLRRARRITCVSEATRLDVERLVGAGAGGADVTEMGLNYGFAPMPAAKAAKMVESVLACRQGGSGGGGPPRYLLHVGGNPWYKNRLGLLRLYARLVARAPTVPALVMVGPPLTREMRVFAAKAGMESRLLTVEDCPDEVLRALYSLAELLVFPSWHEGFGWPIAEAEACGCRVATSDRAPMTTVGWTAAFYFDPSRVDEAADVVWEALNEGTAERKERIERGLENAARFSTATMVRQYAAIYQELAAPESPAAEPGRLQAA